MTSTSADSTVSSRYLDGTYRGSNTSWHEQDAAWKAEAIAAFLERSGGPPETIVDVGCGTGGVLADLATRWPGVRVQGYDPSPHAVAMAAQLRRQFVTDVLPAGPPADLVMAIDVLEHIPDYYGFLQRLIPLGRHLLFHIPLDVSVSSILRRQRLPATHDSVGHLHFFTEETALLTLSTNGLEVLDQQRTWASLDRRAPSAKASLARLARRSIRWASADLAARVLGGASLLVLARPKEPSTAVSEHHIS